MLLVWKMRYLDTRDREFKDRVLWLDTGTLEPVTKAVVEAIHDLRDTGRGREMLRYRQLFREQSFGEEGLTELCHRHGEISGVCIPDYSEDEQGRELTNKEMAVVLTGDPDAMMFPAGARQHDIDYSLAGHRPVPIDQITLPAYALEVLGYFARDLRELRSSALCRDGGGTLTGCEGADLRLQTAVSDEEIRSFVTIFRRLYMQREPYNFSKAVAVFAKAIDGYPLAEWVKGVLAEYEAEMGKPPDFFPLAGSQNWSFSRKRLIDVFLYTQYHHQPVPKRTRQFEKCLQEVGGNRDILTWLFLTELHLRSLHMSNAGKIIADFYERYCQHHQIAGRVLDSVSRESLGIGTLEKKEARRERILAEKAEELAEAMWEKEGRPEGGPEQFRDVALERLVAAMSASQVDKAESVTKKPAAPRPKTKQPVPAVPGEPLKAVFTSEVLRTWYGARSPTDSLRDRLDVVTACGPYPADREKAYHVRWLRARKAAMEAYIGAAFSCGMFNGERGKDLRMRLTGTQDVLFRSGMAECMTCWFLAGHMKLPVDGEAKGRNSNTLDMQVVLPDGLAGVEVKAPLRNRPSPGTVWTGDDSDKIMHCIKKANKQFTDDRMNLLVVAPSLRTTMFADRRVLVRAAYGKSVIVGDFNVALGRIENLRSEFAPRGKFLNKQLRGGNPIKPDGLPACRRISAMICLEERLRETHPYPVEDLVCAGSGFHAQGELSRIIDKKCDMNLSHANDRWIEHAVLILHNPNAHHPISEELWTEFPQLVAREDEMAWTDGYDRPV